MHARTHTEAEGIDRRLVAGAYLVVFLAFFLTQRIFAGLTRFPSWGALAIISAAVLTRVAELLYIRSYLTKLDTTKLRRIALASIASSLALALPLAIASHESDTPYFGMLMLPILETAIYFSLKATVAVAAVSSSFSIFWVVYAGNFHPPFAVGEMLESATLVLVFFIVGCLVWLLMNRIRQRTRELARHIEDLERSRTLLIEQEKLAAVGRLASSVAHEIRNPVAIISSALEAAGSDTFALTEREEMSRVAMVEARRLEKLTTDFLSYANVSGEQFERLNLGTLAGYVEGIVRVQAMNKRLRVDLKVDGGDSCIVQGNEGQLQQVLLNLMRNAVDAAPDESTIRVHVHPDSRDDAVITIENGGLPIPAAAVERIFEPFFTNKANGTGLGLAIARRIVEQHGGTLHLTRNEREHVMFTLSLPANPAAKNIANKRL